MVHGTTNDKELATELKSMGLSVDDQLDVLTYMLKKPEYVATFKSIDGEIREAFVTRVMVHGTTNDKELATELKSMGLSVDDQLDVLTYMLKKPEYVATFKSIDGEIREAFVTRVLREVRSSR
ncbi:hypothetical protein G4B88_002581 [Cannabis sativa]|uniref:Uncharacterized protein n=1 Tax=Cannabis sativa TaxID=3483 RepID=A0A7J6I9J2_CANSA|nr:hypothetical protein G4B88_002581 [Cannabis sativa]